MKMINQDLKLFQLLMWAVCLLSGITFSAESTEVPNEIMRLFECETKVFSKEEIPENSERVFFELEVDGQSAISIPFKAIAAMADAYLIVEYMLSDEPNPNDDEYKKAVAAYEDALQKNYREFSSDMNKVVESEEWQAGVVKAKELKKVPTESFVRLIAYTYHLREDGDVEQRSHTLELLDSQNKTRYLFKTEKSDDDLLSPSNSIRLYATYYIESPAQELQWGVENDWDGMRAHIFYALNDFEKTMVANVSERLEVLRAALGISTNDERLLDEELDLKKSFGVGKHLELF